MPPKKKAAATAASARPPSGRPAAVKRKRASSSKKPTQAELKALLISDPSHPLYTACQGALRSTRSATKKATGAAAAAVKREQKQQPQQQASVAAAAAAAVSVLNRVQPVAATAAAAAAAAAPQQQQQQVAAVATAAAAAAAQWSNLAQQHRLQPPPPRTAARAACIVPPPPAQVAAGGAVQLLQLQQQWIRTPPPAVQLMRPSDLQRMQRIEELSRQLAAHADVDETIEESRARFGPMAVEFLSMVSGQAPAYCQELGGFVRSSVLVAARISWQASQWLLSLANQSCAPDITPSHDGSYRATVYFNDPMEAARIQAQGGVWCGATHIALTFQRSVGPIAFDYDAWMDRVGLSFLLAHFHPNAPLGLSSLTQAMGGTFLQQSRTSALLSFGTRDRAWVAAACLDRFFHLGCMLRVFID